jgi:hypothetical protein
MKKVKVESIGFDELYSEFFECECGKSYILKGFKYCPNCGKEIEW